jgi:hypothetical protein
MIIYYILVMSVSNDANFKKIKIAVLYEEQNKPGFPSVPHLILFLKNTPIANIFFSNETNQDFQDFKTLNNALNELETLDPKIDIDEKNIINVKIDDDQFAVFTKKYNMFGFSGRFSIGTDINKYISSKNLLNADVLKRILPEKCANKTDEKVISTPIVAETPAPADLNATPKANIADSTTDIALKPAAPASASSASSDDLNATRTENIVVSTTDSEINPAAPSAAQSISASAPAPSSTTNTELKPAASNGVIPVVTAKSKKIADEQQLQIVKDKKTEHEAALENLQSGLVLSRMNSKKSLDDRLDERREQRNKRHTIGPIVSSSNTKTTDMNSTEAAVAASYGGKKRTKTIKKYKKRSRRTNKFARRSKRRV